MPAVVESAVAGTELERVLPKVTTVYESDDTFFANIKKRDVEIVSYREMRAPMELRPGGRFAYFNPDGNDMGRGGGPTWDKAVLRPVFMLEAIEYTKLLQEVSGEPGITHLDTVLGIAVQFVDWVYEAPDLFDQPNEL